MSSSHALKAALALISDGLFVFPCSTDKAPTSRHGYKDATNSPEAAIRLWNRYPGPLIGVPTGEVLGFDILDIDPKNDGAIWLERYKEELPLTRFHKTRSGGWHYFFRHRVGLRNSAGRIAPGIDVRADGGYIIWWPATGLDVFNNAILSPWPEWVFGPIESKVVTPYTPTSPTEKLSKNSEASYARAALRQATKAVSNAREGTRNNTLNKEMWSLLRFVQTGDLSIEEIATAMALAGFEAGMEKREIESTIASSIRARSNVAS